jgi:hypothetical protein
MRLRAVLTNCTKLGDAKTDTITTIGCRLNASFRRSTLVSNNRSRRKDPLPQPPPDLAENAGTSESLFEPFETFQ